MSSQPVRVEPLDDHGDQRGSSFSLPLPALLALASAKDIHIMTLRPSQVRGNHFHTKRHEYILVVYSDSWSLHYDMGSNTDVQHHTFAGAGGTLIQVELNASHAIRNDGATDLVVIAWSDIAFDPQHPDSFARKVI